MDHNSSTVQDPLAVAVLDAAFFLRTQAATIQREIRTQLEKLIADPPRSCDESYARLTSLRQQHWQTVPRFEPATNEEVAADYAAAAVEWWTAGADGGRVWRNAIHYAKRAGAWVTIPPPPDTPPNEEPAATEGALEGLGVAVE